MAAIGGVIAAVLTPRKESHADVAALLELIDWLCAAGVRGLALLGATGEFAALSLDERARLAFLAAKRSRVPLLVGVGHASLDGAVELAREAAAAGAAGVLLMPPYFFRYDQEEIRGFYREFARQSGGIPTYLYNIPFFTSPIALETALELLASGAFAGIKDSSGDLAYIEALVVHTVLAGNDSIYAAARQAGAAGGVSGVACAVPELMLALDKEARFQARVGEFIAWIDRFPTPTGIRIAAGVRGLKTGPPPVPLSPEKERLRGEFEEWFRAWLPAVLKECQP
jgi:dihydrodipicolinate synthase/N-acetylneuraminate lyase